MNAISGFESARSSIQEYIRKCEYIIIKLGTHLLTPILKSQENLFFEALAREIAQIKALGKNVIIVSSGAVGLGKKLVSGMLGHYALDKKELSIVERQAMASLGQSLLINTYREALQKQGLTASQILLSNSDFRSRKHYVNLRNTMTKLFSWNAVPVVNENDTVATEELRFGDNDTLAAAIAGMYPQSFLIILSTVDGFYMNGEKRLFVEKVGSLEMKHAGAALGDGMGGMKTKLHAARNLLRCAQLLNISSGETPQNISKIMNADALGTWFFQASSSSLNSRRRWLLYSPYSSASIEIDHGAEQAIVKHGSLLAVGIKKIEGSFSTHDLVLVKNSESRVIARGTTSIDSDTFSDSAEKKGLEVIHRDNLVLV